MTICQCKCKKSKLLTEIKKSIARQSCRFSGLPRETPKINSKTEELWRFSKKIYETLSISSQVTTQK